MGTSNKSPELVRAIVEDRMDQLTVQPVPDKADSGSEIEPSPLWLGIEDGLYEVAARVAGGEVVPFGMRDVVDGLMDTIRDTLTEWAIGYTLGERSKAATDLEAIRAAG